MFLNTTEAVLGCKPVAFQSERDPFGVFSVFPLVSPFNYHLISWKTESDPPPSVWESLSLWRGTANHLTASLWIQLTQGCLSCFIFTTSSVHWVKIILTSSCYILLTRGVKLKSPEGNWPGCSLQENCIKKVSFFNSRFQLYPLWTEQHVSSSALGDAADAVVQSTAAVSCRDRKQSQ